ncbi:MBL fold metallo-hydrolase, partial [Acidisphaera sp. L21]|uniref:MBL fold metallo-hydrolase n=1 Tax=Acidisphaera sp. L21 TaxID=1641851 RepID=UPI00131ADFFB
MPIHLTDMRVDQVIESTEPLFDPFTFFPTLTPAMVEANKDWLYETAIDPVSGKLVLALQSYLVRTPHHTILIDTCVGNDKERTKWPFWHQLKTDAYVRALATAGVGFEDIDYVLCTHLHVDHVGWNTRLLDGRWVPTFPNARYVFSAKELGFWEAKSTVEPLPWIVDSVLPVVAAGMVEAVSSDHVLDDYVRLEPTPGHTIDHFVVQLGRHRTEAVVTGDLFHSPLQLRYPELSMRGDFDGVQSKASRNRFLSGYC